MKSLMMNIVTFTVLVFASNLVMALTPLPPTGFTVSAGVGQPTGGTSAYRLCNTTGNFGSTISSPIANACRDTPASSTTSPVSGYSLIASSTSTLSINDTAHTNGTTIVIGSFKDYVWRNAAATSCIYGVRATLTSTDYDLNKAGTQTFDINDIARSGFGTYDASNTINAGYFQSTSTDDELYRVGRAFTSVQHKATTAGTSTGYYDLPLITPVSGAPAINGTTTGTPTLIQQTAAIDTNWVNFTTDADYADLDVSTFPSTPLFYVQATCTSATPVKQVGALRFRQTGQDTGQDFIELSAAGYVP